jgi:hypothetical protein
MEGIVIMQNQISIEQIFDNLSRTAPEILTRQKINELTGGLISAKTLANLDSENDGIRPRLRIGGKVAYPREAVVAFLKNRCEIF